MSSQAATAFAVEQSVQIAAPRERVFALLSDRAELARWMHVTAFEPRVGGRFEMTAGEWVAYGEITEIDPPRTVAYTWDWRNQPLGVRTEVRFDLEEDGQGTLLRLTHTGFADAEQQTSHTQGWGNYLGRLHIVAEGGDPGPDKYMEQ